MLRYLLLLFFGIQLLELQAQRVSNIAVIQGGQKLHIQYELISTSPVEVGLYISENNGSTWSKITQHLSGDVGPKVSGGNKEMVWDVLQARESLVGNAIVFKVKAGGEIKSVKIGNQVWMSENLNVDHYRNGDLIPTGLSNTQWESTTLGAYAIYNDDPANEKIYGKLYNWYAVNDSRGLCPAGWRLPDEYDWNILEKFISNRDVGGSAALKSEEYWNGSFSVLTNSTGFNGLPAGYRNSFGKYSNLNETTYWFSFDSTKSQAVRSRRLKYNSNVILNDSYFLPSVGMSIRCIKI